ncbi:MAG: hypothetical protein AAF632_16920 [Bacteroidota bacterium]
MRSILMGMVLLFFCTQCREIETESPTSLLLGSWKHANNETIIRFDQNQTYTVQFEPGPVFHLSYRLDDLNQLVIYDSSFARTYSLEFLNTKQLRLTDLDFPRYLDVVQRNSIFYRAE